jgi:hypothetical protein
MNAEHTAYLIDKYPVLYQGHTWPITQGLMAFGFECGDGWLELIDQLSSDITELDKRDGSTTIAVQIKEKYGGLRFYVQGGTDAAYDLIDAAEELSLKTCEACGKPGSLKGVHWLSTRCDACWSRKLDEDKKP